MERSTTELTGRLAEYARLAERVKALQDGVHDLRGTGYSTDGLVTAVVGGRGELLELSLDPRIYREPNAAELAAKIVAAVHEAAAEAEREATGLAAKLMPRDRRADVDPRFDLALHVLGEASALEGRK
ncbi:YbaB/EbfC family nucleoid-associated protein [Actinophytocola sp.]|uniref:YbaB/EbfC family nucleoid-associated protein n=1 Tax=Actinophytocola sp. TaxID=1872138 RepID=UPI00389A0666